MKLPFVFLLLFAFCCDVVYAPLPIRGLTLPNQLLSPRLFNSKDVPNMLTYQIHKVNSKLAACKVGTYSPMKDLASFTTAKDPNKPQTEVTVQKSMMKKIFKKGVSGTKTVGKFLVDVGVPATALAAVVGAVYVAGVALATAGSVTPVGIAFWCAVLGVIAPLVAIKDTNFVQNLFGKGDAVAIEFNQKMDNLASEMNKKFSNLKIYVDDTNIESHIQQLTIWFKTESNAFYNLAKYAGTNDTQKLKWLETLEKINFDGAAKESEFMWFWDGKKIETDLSVLDARKLETSLFFFSGWASLRIIELLILSTTYEAELMNMLETDPNYNDVKKTYTMHATDMFRACENYRKYLQAAQEIIPMYRRVHSGQTQCLKSIECRSMPEINNDYVEECSCEVDKFVGMECTATVQVKKVGMLGGKKVGTDYEPFSMNSVNGEKDHKLAARKYAEKLLGGSEGAEKYGTEAFTMVAKFWIDELKDFRDTFEEAQEYIKVVANTKFNVKLS